MPNGYVLLALAEDRAPAYSAEELAVIPASAFPVVLPTISSAVLALQGEAASVRYCLDSLPIDAELVYWRLRRVVDELGELRAALAQEEERRWIEAPGAGAEGGRLCAR